MGPILATIWSTTALFLLITATLGLLPLLLLVVSRLSRMRDPLFDHRPNAPAHQALHSWALVLWGVIIPVLYELSAGTREVVRRERGLDVHFGLPAVGIGCKALSRGRCGLVGTSLLN